MFIAITDHIALDRELRIVRVEGKEIQMTGLEFGLLEYLATHPNKICSKTELIDHVWGNKFQYDPGTIDVHLNAIRRKTGWTKNKPIETLRGIGLVFRTEQKPTVYTIDLQSFAAEWIETHTVELQAKSIVPHIRLTPFVNYLSIAPEALRSLLDAVLAAFLPSAKPGVLRLSSKLTMNAFVLSLDINGTVNELRIPIYGDLSVS